MKQMKGLDFWVKSSIWLELAIPGYFFGKTFGTADAKAARVGSLAFILIALLTKTGLTKRR